MSQSAATQVTKILDQMFSGDQTVFDDHPGLADVRKNAMLIKAFSDLRQSVVQQIVEGDRVATHSILSGTNDGPIFGRPATGKSIDFPFLCIVQLENGRIISYSSALDWLKVLTGLGLFSFAP